MSRLFLLRFSITSLRAILSKKLSVVLNFAIFLTFFAITASAISIYFENKIEKLETDLINDEINHIIYTKWLNRTPKLVNDINNITDIRKRETSFTPIIKYFPDDKDNTTSRLYSTKEEFYNYYYFIIDALVNNFDSINLILIDSILLSSEEKDIQSVRVQKEFFNNLVKQFDFLFIEEKNYFDENKNKSETFESDQIFYLKYDNFLKKSLIILREQRDFYLNFSLNYFSKKRTQFNENNSKRLIEITDFAKLETRLIFSAFLIQFFIFIILQIFEITLERKNQNEKK